MLGILNEEIERFLKKLIKETKWTGFYEIFDEDGFGVIYLDDVRFNLLECGHGDGSAGQIVRWSVHLPNHCFEGEFEEQELGQ